MPITPAPTGNGLAMRAGMLLDALADAADVHLVIVPVSGPGAPDPWVLARAASVTVAPPDAVARSVPALDEPPDAVLTMRTYLAPVGIPLAEQLGATRVVVDADDDDSPLLASLGDAVGAAAADALAREWLPRADAVLAASPVDAAGLTARAALDDVAVVPNAVAIPESLPPAPGGDRLLFVGNLTYEPNVVAAQILATEVLPRVRARRPNATAQLVGPASPAVADLARERRVEVTGAVAEIAPHLAAADVAVVPLRHGAGTRIKVLEAFAHRRPVVATATAVAGLAVEHRTHMLLAEEPGDLADLVVEVLADPAAHASMVDRAATLVQDAYSPPVVAPLVRVAVLGADA